MWSLWAEDPVPRSKHGGKIHGRWYVIEIKINKSLQAIKTKLTQWSNNVDLSEDSLKNWNPNIMLGTTVQSMNKGNFCYLALKNVSHQTPRESFLNLLQDLQREFKVEITTGWVRWLTGENEDMQFDIRKTGLAVLLLGSVTDQIRSSVRPTKIPWAETSETILLNLSLALTEDELLLSSLEEEMLFPTPQQNCITRSKNVYHSVDHVDRENVPKTSIKTEPTEHDTEHDEPFTPSPDLFQSYDERCSAIAAPPPVTDYHGVNNTASNHHSLTVRTVKKEASPDTLWSSSIPDLIHKKNGNEIHGRWYILQIMIHDRQESIIAELTQWSRNIDLSTEFLRNWNPKLTLGISVESSSQNYSYYLILKNVSSWDTRTSLLHLLEDLKHQQRISVSTGWVRWLTGPKGDCQFDMYISSLKLLLLGTAKEQTSASVWALGMPWLEKPAALLLDITLSNAATEERNKLLPKQGNKSDAPWPSLTEAASEVDPVTTAVTPNESTQTHKILQDDLRLRTQSKGQIRGGSPLLKIRCQCCSVELGVPDWTQLCNSCDRRSCSERSYYGIVLNIKDEPPPTPPATASPASGRSVIHNTIVTLPATASPASGRFATQNTVTLQASASPASGRSVIHNTIVTPPATASPASGCPVIHNTIVTLPASASPASGRSIIHNTIVTPPATASPASGRSVIHNTIVTLPASASPASGRLVTQNIVTPPASASPSLTASVQASTSSHNYAQTSQFSENNTGRSQHRQFYSQSSQPSQNDGQRSRNSQNRAQNSKTDQPGIKTSQIDQGRRIHNSDSLSCSTVQHNVMNTDIEAPVQRVLLASTNEAKLLRDLQQHHYTEIGQHIAFTVISRNPLTVQCSVCNITVSTGNIEQQFPNLRYHLSDKSHKFNLSALEDKDPVNAIFEWIARTYTNKFLLKTTFAVCRCDKVEISLLPAGNPYHAIHAHINSKKHKNASEKFVDSEDITKYFKIKKTRRFK